MDFLSPQVLSQLKFDSTQELYIYMKTEALKSGFELCAKKAKYDAFGLFYCSKGGSSNSNSTNKCNCPFTFSSSPDTTSNQVYYKIRIDESLILQHCNHNPEPNLFAHKFIDDDLKSKVQQLHQSGISPSQIQSFLLNIKAPFLSTLQIQAITKKDQVLQFNNETDPLIHYIESNGGICHDLTIQCDDGPRRIALLTFNTNELLNLRNYSDVIFLDGTYSSLVNKWEVFPITAFTKECNLCCCGIMYAASANEDVLYWLLNTLSIYPDFISNIMTIITDEDHSFINAFKKWISSIKKPNVNHVICALHKSRNFGNKLIKYGFSKTQRALIKNLFKIVCYHPNLEYVHKALEKLHNFTPRLTHYIEKHIVPYLKSFSRAYLCNVLCHGYNTSSPAESMNNLIKRSLPRQNISLVESRMYFDRNFKNHYLTCQIKSNTMRYLNLFEGCFSVAPKILRKINVQLQISNKIELKQIDANTYLARHNTHQDVIYTISNGLCSCKLHEFAGYPCAHVLQLYFQLHLSFPIHLISPKWIKSEPPHQSSIMQQNLNAENDSLEQKINDNNDELINIENEESEKKDDLIDDSFNDIDDEMNDAEKNDDEISNSQMLESVLNTETSRYLTIFHKGKELAKLASSDLDVSSRVLEVLQREINAIMNISFDNVSCVNKENQMPIQDALARPKGAPKKGRKPKETNMVDRNEQPTCAICTFHHPTEECHFFNKMQELIRKNKALNMNSDGRRCSLCFGLNHQNRNCPLRTEAKEYYEEQNFI